MRMAEPLLIFQASYKAIATINKLIGVAQPDKHRQRKSPDDCETQQVCTSQYQLAVAWVWLVAGLPSAPLLAASLPGALFVTRSLAAAGARLSRSPSSCRRQNVWKVLRTDACICQHDCQRLVEPSASFS